MRILEISKFPQTGRVCSDHFDKSSYHPSDDYKSKMKKLLSHAVPKLKRKVFGDISNLQAPSNNKCTTSYQAKADGNVQRRQDDFSMQLLAIEENANGRVDSDNNLQYIDGMPQKNPQASVECKNHSESEIEIEISENCASKRLVL